MFQLICELGKIRDVNKLVVTTCWHSF